MESTHTRHDTRSFLQIMRHQQTIVSPGYTGDAVSAAGGNPCGTSADAGKVTDEVKSAVKYQSRRPGQMIEKLVA
jgi:NAD(P)H dehydrogenase (quinone)